MPETMKLLGSAKKINRQKKKGKKVSNCGIVEVVLLSCNLVDNQYQQKSELFYTFMPNKSYAYLLKLKQVI